MLTQRTDAFDFTQIEEFLMLAHNVHAPYIVVITMARLRLLLSLFPLVSQSTPHK